MSSATSTLDVPQRFRFPEYADLKQPGIDLFVIREHEDFLAREQNQENQSTNANSFFRLVDNDDLIF